MRGIDNFKVEDSLAERVPILFAVQLFLWRDNTFPSRSLSLSLPVWVGTKSEVDDRCGEETNGSFSRKSCRRKPATITAKNVPNSVTS